MLEMPEETGRGMHGSTRRPPQLQAALTSPFSGEVVLLAAPVGCMARGGEGRSRAFYDPDRASGVPAPCALRRE